MPVVLVVDDDGMFRGWVKATLGEEYDVLECPSAEEALEKLGEQPVDLILSDIMMPGGMLGTQFCEAVRRNPDYFEIPFVFMTAWGPELEELGMMEDDAYGDSLLNKPMSVQTLRRVVARFANAGRARVPEGGQRRSHGRAPVDIDVKVAAVGDDGDDVLDPLGPSRMLDVSSGGAFIFTKEDDPLPIGTRCRVWFVLPHDTEPLQLHAEVIHRQSGNRPGMGVRFLAPSPEELERIEGYVQRIRRLVSELHVG